MGFNNDVSMEIPLNEFEQYVSEKILKRGYQYFIDGYIDSVEEYDTGIYEAVVAGSYDYLVRLHIEDDMIQSHSCSCPYDYGPICKHVVAVIFHVQNDVFQLTQMPVPYKAKPKRKTIAQHIDELLQEISHEDLKQFVRTHTEDDIDFGNLFLSSFMQLSSEESINVYKKQLQTILMAATDRRGYIPWDMTNTVGNAVYNMWINATEQADKGNYKTAFYICVAIMEKMTEALQYADDSDGSISGPIYDATEMLHRIAREQSDGELRSNILDYCISAVDKRIYYGWDTEFDLLRLASKIIQTDEEKNQLLNTLEYSARSEYEREVAQNITYDIFLRMESKEVAAAYLKQHIGNSTLRRKALQSAMEEKAFAQAKTLANDGIEYDKNKRPGLVKNWYGWLLKIAEAEEDAEKIIEYARLLYLDGYGHSKEYYELMKENVAEEDWGATVEELLKEIQGGKSWRNRNKVAEIYIEEKWWARLMEVVRDSPDFSTLDAYSKYLVRDYADEITDFYIIAIKEDMEINMGRKHYQSACRYLQKVIKLGAREKAEETIAFLLKKYPRRSALMEELSKV